MMVGDGDGYRIGGGLAGASRVTAFVVTVVVYVVAGLAALLTVDLVGGHPLLVTFWADIVATVVVFAASVVVANASLYDPYWSVAPPVVVAGWVLYEHAGDAGADPARQLLVLACVLLWAARLTLNWARAWRGLDHEDWRYRQLRAERPAGVPWWLINLVGIQLMPTLVVFVGLLACWPAVAVAGAPLGPLDAVAVVVTLAAIAVEASADRQLRRFAADPACRGTVLDQGLWRYSRHPNYLGEIGFWWGMWFFGLAAAPGWWWTVVGPLAMVLLFVTVSVPMMDRRSLIRRPGYAEHMRRVPALLPRLRRADPTP